MAPPALSHTYCTQADVEHLLSQAGVVMRLDDDNDGSASNPFELHAMQDSINDATESCNYFLFMKYDPANLANSNWVNRRATILAAYDLCGRRGNPVPESLAERAEKALEELEAVAEAYRLLPGIPLRRTCAPTWDNVRCDPRYNWKVIRVERNTSSPQTTSQPVNQDWMESFAYEI